MKIAISHHLALTVHRSVMVLLHVCCARGENTKYFIIKLIMNEIIWVIKLNNSGRRANIIVRYNCLRMTDWNCTICIAFVWFVYQSIYGTCTCYMPI